MGTCLSGSTAIVTTYKVIEVSKKKTCKCEAVPQDSELSLDNGNLAEIIEKSTIIINVPGTISYTTSQNTLCTIKLKPNRKYNIIDIVGKKVRKCSC